MNYAEARQRSDKSGWAFTIRNDDDIWTAACCRTDEQDEDGYRAHKHASKEEAEECFHFWRLRQAEAWEESTFSDWTGCEAQVGTQHRPSFGPEGVVKRDDEGRPLLCDKPTKRAARFHDLGGPTFVRLCDEHLTTASVVHYVQEHRITGAMYS